MPRSVVYRIFRSREDLDEQIRARITDDLMAALSPALDPKGTIREAIELAAATYVGWVALHPHLHRFLGTGSPGEPATGSRAVAGTRTAVALHLARLLDTYAERLLDGEPAPTGFSSNLAFGMVGLVDGVVNQWAAHPGSRSSLDDLTHFLSDSLWGSSRAPPRASASSSTPTSRSALPRSHRGWAPRTAWRATAPDPAYGETGRAERPVVHRSVDNGFNRPSLSAGPLRRRVWDA